MKRIGRRALALFLTAGLLLLCMPAGWAAESAPAGEDYQNPITSIFAPDAPQRGAGDPFVMRWNGVYYLYCSSGTDQIPCWTSRDLVHWESGGVCA